MNLKNLLNITEPKDHSLGVPVTLIGSAIDPDIRRTQDEIWNFFANVFGIERSGSTLKALDCVRRKMANDAAKAGGFEQPYPPVSLDDVMPFDYADKTVQWLVRGYAVAERASDLQSLIKARDMITFAFAEWESRQDEKAIKREGGVASGESRRADAELKRSEIRNAAISLLNSGKPRRSIATMLEQRGHGSSQHIRRIIKDL